MTTQNGCSLTNCLKFCLINFSLANSLITRPPVSTNRQTNMSTMPDPYCTAVNVFNVSWKTRKIYAFPPFSLVEAAILKLIRANNIGIMIIPKWTTQHWFPTMLAHLVDHSIQLPSGLKTLSLTFKPSKAHPLSPKLQLLAVILLGNSLHGSAYREKLKRSSLQPGNLKLLQNTHLSLTDGNIFVYEGVKIGIHHLQIVY